MDLFAIMFISMCCLLGISLLCAVALFLLSVKKRSIIWSVYSLIQLLGWIPLFLSCIPQEHPLGETIGLILFFICLFLWTIFTCCSSPSNILLASVGLIGLLTYSGHLVILINPP